MKGRSCALEITVEINSDELAKLRSDTLEGTLRFEDWFSKPNIDRNIPISIKIDGGLNDFLSVEGTPKDEYLGNAERIDFGISTDYYEELVARMEYGARFWGSGKLIMRVK